MNAITYLTSLSANGAKPIDTFKIITTLVNKVGIDNAIIQLGVPPFMVDTIISDEDKIREYFRTLYTK